MVEILPKSTSILLRGWLRKLRNALTSGIARNAISLYAVQGLQYLIPVFTLPWLVRSLGKENYGIFCLSVAFGGYLQVICDYGFQLSATKELSRIRDDRLKVSKLVSEVLGAKLLLTLPGILGATLVVYLTPSYRSLAFPIFLAGIGSIAGSFFPNWLFQGMEKMSFMAIISVFARIFQVILLIVFVRNEDHLILALWIQFIGTSLGTGAAWLVALLQFKIRIQPMSITGISSLIKEGWEVFVSQAGAIVLGNTNIVVLAAIASPSVVGTYSIAEKIARLGMQLTGPIGIVIYPRASKLLAKGESQLAFTFFRSVIFKGGAVFLSLSIAMAALADFGVLLISGSHDSDVVFLVWLLSPLPLSVFLDNVFGTQILLNLGFKRLFMFGPILGGGIAIICQASLVPIFQAEGAALSLLLSEFAVLSWFYWMCYSKTSFRIFSKRVSNA